MLTTKSDWVHIYSFKILFHHLQENDEKKISFEELSQIRFNFIMAVLTINKYNYDPFVYHILNGLTVLLVLSMRIEKSTLSYISDQC